jgi:uncharacterized membrane protein YgdD (TMEM256/DUF423 family)
MAQILFLLGALSGGLSVALGAFGAHALEARLDAKALGIFETGVRYQGLHAMALLVTALVLARGSAPGILTASGWSFVVGTLLFCGSLYALALGGPRILGAVAPLGGSAFLLGWILLAVGGWRALG